jgi:adenosylcobinamide-GDP ribazoletransferase
MKTLVCAIGLLTRIPVPTAADAETAGKAARWFPLVGALIGGIYAVVAWVGMLRLPAAVVAVLVVVAEALLTGALHMDGLADTADGFGGGKTRDDILRIMRDPSIGSYGATALALMVAWKVTALAALIEKHAALPYLVLAPVLGRWTVSPLGSFLKYARPGKAVASFVGTEELIWATLLAAAIAAPIAAVIGVAQSFACWTVLGVVITFFGAYCQRKIGGITGDTLGAAVEIAECVVLLVALF